MPPLPVRAAVYEVVLAAVRRNPFRWSDMTLRAALASESLDPTTIEEWLDEMEALLVFVRRFPRG